MSDEPKEQTPHWHLKRAYALLFSDSLADPAAAEACGMIDDAHRLINGKDEPQPIRRGDVVQVDPAAWGGRVRPRIWIVLDIDEHGFAKTGFSPDVPLSRCVRIGRARYYPDGTPVED